MHLEIKNKQVEEIYNCWDSIWKNTDNNKESRFKAYTIKQVIEAISYIYEHDRELEQEDIDNLFITWGDGVEPVFPEDVPKILERMKEI